MKFVPSNPVVFVLVIIAFFATGMLFGKMFGKNIEVVNADHQNKPDIAKNVTQQWFDRDGVDMTVENLNSAVALTVQALGREKNKITIVTGAATSRLTNEDCAPATGIHYLMDTIALSNVVGKAIVKDGGDSWFFLTADYAFGHQLQADTTRVVQASGGTVAGSVRSPLNASDFSSFLLQAQASKAKIIGLANAGGDTINSIKQAAEFGITKGGQNLAGLLVFLPDVHSLGLNVAQGLMLTETFYWDLNDQTRAWSRRFASANSGKMPSMVQAGVYSSVIHYLKAVEAAKTDDGTKVAAKMKELPTDDPLFGKGVVRADGRKIHPAYLFEVKKPSESKGPYDYYKLVATIPANEAFRPITDGDCPLVKK